VAVRALVEHDDLAGLDVADIFRADDVERAGLRGQDRAAVEFAEHQRADAERIARADQLLVGQRDQRIGALELARSASMKRSMKRLRFGARDQMQDHLGVGGRLHHGAVRAPARGAASAVGEVAVVADREAAGIELGEQRLHVAQDGFAGGGIADMADGALPGRRSITSRREKVSPTRPMRRSEWKACRRRRRCRRPPGRDAAGRAGRAR
jgi:hypothetical protein